MGPRQPFAHQSRIITRTNGVPRYFPCTFQAAVDLADPDLVAQTNQYQAGQYGKSNARKVVWNPKDTFAINVSLCLRFLALQVSKRSSTNFYSNHALPLTSLFLSQATELLLNSSLGKLIDQIIQPTYSPYRITCSSPTIRTDVFHRSPQQTPMAPS